MTRKRRKIFNKGSATETKDRNSKMFAKFQKLIKKGKYGRMELYQMLADEFDIEERNSVGSIIRNIEKENLITKQLA